MADLRPMKSGKGAVEEEKDRISELPSGVLSHLLSFLSMKEAARTSVLAKDWRWCWLSFKEFDFDMYHLFGDEYSRIRSNELTEEMRIYVMWVFMVLRAHQEATLKTNGDVRDSEIKRLRIRMPLSKEFQYDVDVWISYAFAKKVEILELELLRNLSHKLSVHEFYDRCCFPGRLVGSDFDCLKSLGLTGVNVTGEDVKSILQKFGFLEHLKVCRSDVLQRVEVCGSSLALKNLEILDCFNIEHAIVRDTSLVSLTVTWVNKILLENNPKLVVVRAAQWSRLSHVGNIFEQLSDCFSRVESLTLDASYLDQGEVIAEVPQLGVLKELTLIVDSRRNEALVRLIALLSLSPKLEKFVLEFGETFALVNQEKDNYEEDIKSGRGISLQHLKTVEVREYYGLQSEDGILRYFFAHAQAPIETVIFDPRNLRKDMPSQPRTFWEEVSATKRVELLRKVIPSSVKFIAI